MKSNRKPTVGTIRKSIAPMPDAWLCRKVFQVCDRPRPPLAMYLATVNRRLRDLDAELEKFVVDARRTPQPIGQAHLPDEAADLPWYLWSTAPSARLPVPIQSETRPMPPDNRLRLDNRHDVQHRRKQPIEPDEEQSVRHRQLRPRRYALTQHTQLVSQQYDLGFQSRLRLEWRDQDVDEQDQGTRSLRNQPS